MRFAIATILLLVGCSKESRSNAGAGSSTPDESRLIFRGPAGREIRAADLANVTGTVDWSLVGGENVPEQAAQLHERARAAGSRADYSQALSLLAKAHELAPRWPYPVYDTAYTYELMGEPAKALDVYGQVLALAPRGFFTAMVSADCLRREAAHEWKAGMCKRYTMVEFAAPDAKIAELNAIVSEAPGIAAAWKDLALAAATDDARLVALDAALTHQPDPETRGIVLANKALVLERTGKHDDAVRMLGELALDPKTPLDVEQLAKVSLANITAHH